MLKDKSTVASVPRQHDKKANDGLGNKCLYFNYPTRCGLFSLLHFFRQLYMFRVLTPIVRSCTTVITASGVDQLDPLSLLSWNSTTRVDGSRSGGTQQRERMVVDPVNQYQKL